MRRQTVEEIVTLDAGDYWLGDPCYVIRDEDWMPWLEATGYQTETNLVGNIPGTDHSAVGFQTAFGDGIYPYTVNGKEVFELGVDAGLIGFVPVEYEPRPRLEGLVTKVTMRDALDVRWTDGDISFYSEGWCKVVTNE